MRKIYNFVALFYNILSTYLENILYKKFISNDKFLEKGFHKFQNPNFFKINQEEIKIKQVNKYYKRMIFTKSELDRLIQFIFFKNKIKDKILDKTGFNYSIDFFTAYETSSIHPNDKDKAWYANHPHTDKPFSKNTIKLIIPLQNITSGDGPMKIMDINNSKKYHSKKFNEFESVTCNLNDIFLFNPNLCYHFASSPILGRSRKQMMFQLNPSKNWVLNEKIYNYQNYSEPKFPFFSYIFNSKKDLSLN